MPTMKLLKSCPDNTAQIWQDCRQIARQKSPQSSDEANALGSAAVKPIKSMPIGRQFKGNVGYRIA